MTDSELNRDLQREMTAFAAARISAPVEVAPHVPQRILRLQDGSDQDATAAALAAALQRTTGAPVESLRPPLATAAEAILAAARAGDLLVLPCPFGADYANLRDVSLAATLDVLLARSPHPILAVRGPVADAAAVLAHPLVVLQLDRHRKVEATCHALGVAGRGASVTLLSVVDPQQPVHREELLGRALPVGDLDPEELHSLAGARAAAVVAALQRRAGELGITARLKVRVGSTADVGIDVASRHRGLIVGGLDRKAPGAARALVLGTALPVLLV